MCVEIFSHFMLIFTNTGELKKIITVNKLNINDQTNWRGESGLFFF